MTFIQNTHRFRGPKLTFADWLKSSLIAKLTYEIDVWFQEKILTCEAGKGRSISLIHLWRFNLISMYS
jgi:hypothetical protein